MTSVLTQFFTFSKVEKKNRVPVSSSPLWKKALSYRNALEANYAVYRTRKQLLALDDHLLRDIGITRAQAEEEAAKGYKPSNFKDL